MKATRKRLLLATLGASLIAVLTLLALWLSGGGSTHAQGPIILTIDMDPLDTEWPWDAPNSCPADGVTDCTLGSIDACGYVPVLPGSTFDVDVVVKNLWNGHNEWNWNLAFPDTTTPARLTLIGQIVQDPAVNLIMQSPGSAPSVAGEGVPDAVSPHSASAMDLVSAETTPPFTQGVLARLTFQLGAGATPGIYAGYKGDMRGFSFVPGTYNVYDQDSVGYTNTTGIMALDGYTGGCGYLAIGVPCPQGECRLWKPVGGLAELPDVSSSSSPPYAAIAALAAVAFLAVAVGAWYARRRWLA